MHTWIPILCSGWQEWAPRCLPLNSINSNLELRLSISIFVISSRTLRVFAWLFSLTASPTHFHWSVRMNGNVKRLRPGQSRPPSLSAKVKNKQSRGWLWASEELGSENKSLTDTTNTILLPHFYRFSFFYYFPGFLVCTESNFRNFHSIHALTRHPSYWLMVTCLPAAFALT